MKSQIIFLPALLLFSVTANAQYPYLKAELKSNLSKITCLDDIHLEANQINWEFLSQSEKAFSFQKLHFTSPENGYALINVTGAGEVMYFVKTSDAGNTWDYDSTINQDYISSMQSFGNDTIILLGKKRIDWYVYERYRYLSTDKGEAWNILSNNLETDPQLSFFLNSKRGYCVDQNNGFYVTNDGGINWTKRVVVSVGFKKELYSPHKAQVFLLNDNGLYRSDDEGLNWRKISLPLENGLSDFCLQDNVGFITGRLGAILKTSDGGETWTTANKELYPSLLNVQMYNKDSVYVVGELGTILFSADGGNTWKQQYAENRNDLSVIQIFDAKTIYAGGFDGIFRYHEPEIFSDYLWEPTNLILSATGNTATANSANDALFRVSATGQQGQTYSDSILVDVEVPGIFASSDSTVNNGTSIRLHALTDAGIWSMSNEESVMVYYHDLEVINQDTAFIGGQYDANGVILKTVDGGKSWNHIDQSIQYRIDDIEFANSKIGYAGGYLGYLIKTTDGGTHWEKLVSPTTEDIKSISFVSQDTGYIAADHGQVFKTTDGGNSWALHQLTFDWAFRIKFLTEKKGFLLHNYSGFLSTFDGGETWQEVPHDKFNDLTDLTFVNENVGYVTGSILGPFLYLKTVDGGKSWAEKVFPRWTATTYQTISFKDEYSGFVFDQIGEVITTGDGGQNWFILDTLKYHEPKFAGMNGFPINSFRFLNDHVAIGVGNGQIVRYEFSPDINYLWSPDSKVSGKTTANPNVPSYLSPEYEVTIFRNSECGVSDWVTIPQINESAQISEKSDIAVYPQPASDELFIRLPDVSDLERIEIFDQEGMLRFSKEIVNSSGQISIKPKLNSGLYVLVISGEKKRISKKISFL